MQYRIEIAAFSRLAEELPLLLNKRWSLNLFGSFAYREKQSLSDIRFQFANA
jgi:hypothetical protein